MDARAPYVTGADTPDCSAVEQGMEVTGNVRCPCCGRLHRTALYRRHMAALGRLADICGFGLVIISGYRCPDYNRSVGGTFDSWHILFATDVVPDTAGNGRLERIYRLGSEAGFSGTGLNGDGDYVHLDLRFPPRSWRE